MVKEKINELKLEGVPEKEITSAMKDLGIERARLFGWPNTYVFTKAMGEMLLMNRKDNLPLVIIRPTMVASTYKEPFPGWIEGVRTIDSIIAGYVSIHGLIRRGSQSEIGKGIALTSMSKFYMYMALRFLLPLKALQLLNMLLFKTYQDLYTALDRKVKLVMRLVDLYKPYVFFEGIFDDINTEKLRIIFKESCHETNIFDFDPANIDWEDYMINVHIPGLVKYVMK
ncbi:MALE STERILITY PROTEIN 2-RELATED [Salix koriyanagi]|uniref:Fatty acyl-CoA reductase n=1 Tax=Salix koriyanagi TaxID=2511006 RepID=A0A9Q0TSJ8_9ROSI|nr:MALE STERILITY PROTEIN 2-RELATED [Salix koriyanagi]